MDEFVGRLRWVGQEIATGKSEEGEITCRLDEVFIVPRQLSRGTQMIAERMCALRLAAPDIEQINRIVEEVEKLDESKEVVSTLYEKSIQLSSTYVLSFADNPVQNPIAGFGLSGDIGRLPKGVEACRLTFSWEWFNVVSTGKAAKLQESGELSFEQAETACGNEIVRMLFETDVSIRIKQQRSAKTDEPAWRLRVLKGSEIWWPSLIEGKIVPNGFVS